MEKFRIGNKVNIDFYKIIKKDVSIGVREKVFFVDWLNMFCVFVVSVKV